MTAQGHPRAIFNRAIERARSRFDSTCLLADAETAPASSCHDRCDRLPPCGDAAGRQWIENTRCTLFADPPVGLAAILTAMGLRTVLAFVFVFAFTFGERVDVRAKEPRS